MNEWVKDRGKKFLGIAKIEMTENLSARKFVSAGDMSGFITSSACEHSQLVRY